MNRTWLAPLMGLLFVGGLAACLDANELKPPGSGVVIESTYVDVGIPLDPRQSGSGGTDADAGSGGTDGGGSEDTGPVSECDDERPCTPPFICVEGSCQPECESDEECDEGFVCSEFECVEIECALDDDCDRLSETCEGGLCQGVPCNEVLFTYDPGATTHASVHVAGQFNAGAGGEWPSTIAAGGYALTYWSEENLWWGRFTIPNGVYEYKLVLNEADYIQDPTNAEGVPDGFGGQNSLLTVDCAAGGEGGSCGDLEAFDWRDTVMYFAMVDRFYDGDGTSDPVAGATEGDPLTGPSGQYEGGDLQGVTAQMGYLADLGVTALWITAPFENRDTNGAAIDPGADPNRYSGYHGYWPSPENVSYADPMNPAPTPQVESRIGTAQDLRDMVDAAHGADSANGHGIKVLFDYVMNHVDLESGLYEAHPDWFARRDGSFALCGPENLWDDPYWGTRCAFTDYLPPFDFDNADARAWSVADALWWAREFGIDGYRLDAIKHVPLSWLRDLRSELNAQLPDSAGDRFYLVGETFAYDDAGLIRSFIDPETLLDGQFDFPFKARLCEALFTPGGSMANFSSWMAGNDTFYGPGSLMTTWIGNHDIPRAIHFASREIGNCREGSSPSNGWTSNYPQPGGAEPYERLGLAFAVMMTNPGIPLIYYGDEIGLAGGGDPDNRRAMPWDDTQLSSAQRALRDDVRALARLRAENPVVARGRRVTRSVDQDTWVYSMVGCGDGSPDVTVALNRADAPRPVSVPAGSYVDLLDGGTFEGGSVSLPPRSFSVWRAAP